MATKAIATWFLASVALIGVALVLGIIGVWSHGDYASRWGGTAIIVGLFGFISSFLAAVAYEEYNL